MTYPRRGLIGGDNNATNKGGMIDSRSRESIVNAAKDWKNIPIRKSGNTNNNLIGLRNFHVSYNGKYLFTYEDYGDEIRRYTLTKPFDISTKPDNSDQIFETAGFGESEGYSVCWSNDGHHLYIGGENLDTVTHWYTPDQWDMGSYGNKLRLASRRQFLASDVSQAYDISFKDDGTKMYVACGVDDDIAQYSLSTAWDPQSATHDGNWDPQQGEIRGIYFRTSNDSLNGKRFYFCDDDSNVIRQYSLDDAWDLTGTVTLDTSFSISSQTTNPRAFTMSHDGTKAFVAFSDTIYQWTLSTAWDFSGTVTYDGSKSVGTTLGSWGGSIYGMHFEPGGDRLIIHSYTYSRHSVVSLSSSYDVYNSTVSLVQNADLGYFGSTPYLSSGTYNTEANLPDYAMSSTENLMGVFVSNNYYFACSGIINATTNRHRIHRWNILSSGDVTTIDFGNLYFKGGTSYMESPSQGQGDSTTTRISGMKWSPDGRKFIVLDAYEDKLHHYTCDFSWYISRNTLTYDGYTDIDTSGSYAISFDVALDGKSIIVINDGSNDARLATYKLPGYFQPTNSNPVYDWLSDYNFAEIWLDGDTYPHCIQMSSNGEYLYAAGRNNNKILQFDLITL